MVFRWWKHNLNERSHYSHRFKLSRHQPIDVHRIFKHYLSSNGVDFVVADNNKRFSLPNLQISTEVIFLRHTTTLCQHSPTYVAAYLLVEFSGSDIILYDDL